MGHQFTIEGDEAFTLANELSALTGESVDVAVTAALRDRVEKERARQADVELILAAAREFRAMLGGDLPSPDHAWLYDDEIGLPA